MMGKVYKKQTNEKIFLSSLAHSSSLFIERLKKKMASPQEPFSPEIKENIRRHAEFLKEEIGVKMAELRAKYQEKLQETFPSMSLDTPENVLQTLDMLDDNEWPADSEKNAFIRATTVCCGGTVTFPLLNRGHNLFRVRTRYPKDHPPVTFYKLCVAKPIVDIFTSILHQYATVRIGDDVYSIPDEEAIFEQIRTKNFAGYLKNTKGQLDNNFYGLGDEANAWFNVKVTKIVEEALTKNDDKRPVSGTLRFCFWKNEKEKRICFSVLEYTPMYDREEASKVLCEAAKDRQEQIESGNFGKTWIEKATMEVDVLNGDKDNTLVESE